MEMVPGRVPRKEQGPPPGARVIVWSPCPQKGKRWEQRLSRIQRGPLKVASCPQALQTVLEEGAPHEGLVVLLDLDFPMPATGAAGALAFPDSVWPLLRSCSAVAVVPHLTWKEAGPWLLLGARGVVAWHSADEDVCAVLQAAQSQCVTQLQMLLQRTLNGGCPLGSVRSQPRPQGKLSPREREVLLLVCRDFSNAEIGRRLFVTEANVRFHLSNVYRKLGASSRLQLLLIALSNSWVALQDLLETLC